MKLHELLAINTPLENQANKTRTELAATFEKKRHLFEEKKITFFPLAEGAQPQTESQSDIQSTVTKELQWFKPFAVKALDASHRIAVANTTAVADVVLEDDANTVLLTAVPATSLLELEKRLAEIMALIVAIPTLDPAKGFKQDGAREPGIYVAREINKSRTQKQKKVFVKYEATKEHPAQTELLDQDIVVGKIQEQEWSGLITPADKADLINRVEILSRAVRRARSKANEVEVNLSAKIGDKLLNYILG